MRQILNSLVQYEGIHSASVVSLDGVLVASSIGQANGPREATLSDHEDQPIQTLAALTSGWLGEVSRSIGRLSWGGPYRCVLRATQRTLVIHAFTGSFLLLVLDPDVDPEETRSLMDDAVQHLMGHIPPGGGHSTDSGMGGPYPQGALPSQPTTNVGIPMPGGSISESAGNS